MYRMHEWMRVHEGKELLNSSRDTNGGVHLTRGGGGGGGACYAYVTLAMGSKRRELEK